MYYYNKSLLFAKGLILVCVMQIIAEVVGTYVFVFAGCGAALVYRDDPTALAAAFIPALALMAMIYAVGHVSGAHFNPAVTVAFAVACRLPFIQVSVLLHFTDFFFGKIIYM